MTVFTPAVADADNTLPFAPASLLAAGQRADATAHDAILLLPNRVTLLERLGERARSGATEFAVLLDGAAHEAETAANRLVRTVAGAGVEGVSACVGIAGLSRDASPDEVHRRATLCLSAARSVGAGRVVRYSGGRR